MTYGQVRYLRLERAVVHNNNKTGHIKVFIYFCSRLSICGVDILYWKTYKNDASSCPCAFHVLYSTLGQFSLKLSAFPLPSLSFNHPRILQCRIHLVLPLPANLWSYQSHFGVHMGVGVEPIGGLPSILQFIHICPFLSE